MHVPRSHHQVQCFQRMLGDLYSSWSSQLSVQPWQLGSWTQYMWDGEFSNFFVLFARGQPPLDQQQMLAGQCLIGLLVNSLLTQYWAERAVHHNMCCDRLCVVRYKQSIESKSILLLYIAYKLFLVHQIVSFALRMRWMLLNGCLETGILTLWAVRTK